MQNPPLWAEDLEGHRQPSLYYLNDENGSNVDGPTLICDWNGAPTNYEDFEFDLMSTNIETETLDETHSHSEQQELAESSDEYIELSNPAADLIKPPPDSRLPNQTSVINDFDLVDCRHLDFLSVPPMSPGLLKYVLKQFKQMLQQRATETNEQLSMKKEPTKQEPVTEKK